MTYMLELKHVSYSYQSYQEEIFSDVNYQFKKWDFLQHYRSVWSREINPPIPLGWSGQSQEGTGSL